MRPFLFTAPTRQRRRLRDYVIDLNREKNFNQIVNHFCATFRKAARGGKVFPALVLAVHGPTEMKRIMATNLRRLSIDFENSPADAISGHSEDFEWMTWSEIFDWWFGDDDNEGGGEGAPEDDDTKGLINDEERKQLDEVLDEMDRG